MGGATTLRFFTLISTTPLPLFLHPPRPSSFLLLRRLASHNSYLFLSPHRSPKCSHAQPEPLRGETPSLNSSTFPTSTTVIESHHRLFPEFTDFVDWVSRSGYCNTTIDVNQFVDDQFHQLDEGFVRDAIACLAFAQDHPTLLWSLSKEDIEVVVENGSPFLFRNGSAAAARMEAFVRGGSKNYVLESDKPSTVDLIEFLLSYAHMAYRFSENMQISSRVESSVRKLFNELANSKGCSVDSVATVQKQFSERYVEVPRSVGNKFEMKKGDWMCPRCNFMNFAKNSHCLQCEECRPKKILTGGEWECPHCDFFNFGRNVVCLRCDCKKPGVNVFLSATPVSGLRANTSSVKGSAEEITAGIEKEQQWFTKIAQLEKSSDMSSVLEDEDFPDTMKAGDNMFAGSTRDLRIVDNPVGSEFLTAADKNIINAKIKQSPDELTGEKSGSPMSSSVSSQHGQNSEPKYGLDTYAPVQQHMSDKKSPSQIGNKDYEREQAGKSERWFKKVAELHDVKDLPSAISDDEFPEIMPMRKGENRFVVSKKKDRSLTSPMYKRRVAMEQAGKSNYVPFVPFPPDYFAKDKTGRILESPLSNEPTDAMSLDSQEAGKKKKDISINPNIETSNHVDQNPKSFNSQFNNADDYSKAKSTSENASVRDSWREKTLEGSAVKEPDLLDMSEEAKAERWFRRVAQIKDISELSQIPDEDFPSIMPMRKGANRFVVSKRKTPLERRLTSSQYRRNLPVVRSDPVREETDSN